VLIRVKLTDAGLKVPVTGFYSAADLKWVTWNDPLNQSQKPELLKKAVSR